MCVSAFLVRASHVPNNCARPLLLAPRPPLLLAPRPPLLLLFDTLLLVVSDCASALLLCVLLCVCGGKLPRLLKRLLLTCVRV